MKKEIRLSMFGVLLVLCSFSAYASCESACANMGYLNGGCILTGCGLNPPGDDGCWFPTYCCCSNYYPCTDTGETCTDALRESQGYSPLVDKCVSSTQLVDYSCSGQTCMENLPRTCQYGCENGACKDDGGISDACRSETCGNGNCNAACGENSGICPADCPGGGGGGDDDPPPTTTVHPDNCFSPGETRCFGLVEKRCQDVGGYDDWVTSNPTSSSCCLQQGGAWLEGHGADGCCGSDGVNDLGTNFGNMLCAQDPGYKWITGVEKGRYVGNRILFCNSQFSICYEDAPYYKLASQTKLHCTNLCDFYCDPLESNIWISDKNPLVLNDTLKAGEEINTKSDDLDGDSNTYGCCPAGWCWNSTKCIENQEDESGSLYVYKPTDTPNRCKAGRWEPAKLVHSWDYALKGYCPDPNKQCLVSYDNFSKNNKPAQYFTNEKPQCIGNGQYILDYYCNSSNWFSRTALLATKMMEIIGAGKPGVEFKIFCDNYKTVLNDFSYTVLGKPVLNYIELCNIQGKRVPCVNNFCIIRKIGANFELFGTSLNVPFFNATKGFSDVLGINTCSVASTRGPWEYAQCGPYALHNPNVSIVIFSNSNVPIMDQSGWQVFLSILSTPFATVSELILHGQLQFQEVSGVQLSFDVLKSSPLFQKLYIADINDVLVQGVLEERRWDETQKKPLYYMLITYEGFDEDICEIVNEYTKNFGRVNCESEPGFSVVLDSRETPTYIMNHWTDLTSKFQPLLAE